jgi:hypothetical protein
VSECKHEFFIVDDRPEVVPLNRCRKCGKSWKVVLVEIEFERDTLKAQNEGLREAGAGMIAAERKRQVEEEGWSQERDCAIHLNGELAKAAACYALTYPLRGLLIATIWPWETKWWKPTPDDRIRELVKAGALIAAEIDRLKALGGASK